MPQDADETAIPPTGPAPRRGPDQDLVNRLSFRFGFTVTFSI
jgi:hypothetical protein